LSWEAAVFCVLEKNLCFFSSLNLMEQQLPYPKVYLPQKIAKEFKGALLTNSMI
jgi:hypothetical protein